MPLIHLYDLQHEAIRLNPKDADAWYGKALQKAARHLPAARKRAKRLQAEAESALAEAEALRIQARMEELNLWGRVMVEGSRKGSKTNT